MPKGKKKSVVLVKSAAKKTSKAKQKGKKRTVMKQGPIVKAAEMIGGLIAPGIGGYVGRMAGYAGQKVYNYISGSGDYTVHKNSLLGVSNVPSFGDTVIRMRAREYLGDVNGSTSFVNRSFTLNPGDAKTFPWLSSVAVRFQQYELHGIVFEFVSTSSNALSSTNTALGKVVMATSYNVSAPPFPDVKSALITQFANMGKPADNLVHAIECRKSLSTLDNLYVRATGVDVDDPKFYDFGSFQLVTEGMQAVADIGGLWVSYDITLFKPTLENIDSDIPSQMWSCPGLSGGLFSGDIGPVPENPDTDILPINLSNVSSFIEFQRPEVGDKYVLMFRSAGPSSALPGVVAVAEGITLNSTLFPYYQSATAINTTWEFVRVYEVTSTIPVTFPYIGLSLTLSTPFPNGWTGYFSVTKLNPAIPFTSFPSPLVLESKFERLLRHISKDVVSECSEEKKSRVDSPPVPIISVALSAPGSEPPRIALSEKSRATSSVVRKW